MSQDLPSDPTAAGKKIEAFLGMSLPAAYRSFLLAKDLTVPDDLEYWVPYPDGAWIDRVEAEEKGDDGVYRLDSSFEQWFRKLRKLSDGEGRDSQ